ncbi:TPA: four helix bundle protein [Legionella pneumophila]
MQRAGSSIAQNIAEGSGEYARYEKHRFYRMAKRSATECAVVLDSARKLSLIQTKKISDARNLLLGILSMLIKMVKSVLKTRAETTISLGTPTYWFCSILSSTEYKCITTIH